MLKVLNKLTRTMNKVNRTAKDIEAVGNLLTGKPDKAVRRVKNKAKGKVVNKIFKWLG